MAHVLVAISCPVMINFCFNTLKQFSGNTSTVSCTLVQDCTIYFIGGGERGKQRGEKHTVTVKSHFTLSRRSSPSTRGSSFLSLNLRDLPWGFHPANFSITKRSLTDLGDKITSLSHNIDAKQLKNKLHNLCLLLFPIYETYYFWYRLVGKILSSDL